MGWTWSVTVGAADPQPPSPGGLTTSDWVSITVRLEMAALSNFRQTALENFLNESFVCKNEFEFSFRNAQRFFKTKYLLKYISFVLCIKYFLCSEGSHESSSVDGNLTQSILHFTPSMNHLGRMLRCSATNNLVQHPELTSEWLLNISCE